MLGKTPALSVVVINSYNKSRLDAVQDLIDHPTFENDFTQLAKGLPDLERIVSRIHAKNCKVKDFLKVLSVSFMDYLCYHTTWADTLHSPLGS